ncbi:MAG: D-alanyl-D-alanine carboxypeptidase/D-alanyl-D-alanine-endopeptidase [Dysgonamonadaceae bacterium]|jgi:D-alanyl-D-alanine carboxypeptidase/D-alanyl-D-alanine-endopeptidase (penicillin-binding protein 4)|nr:D-alanyl-D-alanine carboxypeptidase/D-alanyl-D-alanine-endopeptidase [Dysgonamonadaceae bacterium]
MIRPFRKNTILFLSLLSFVLQDASAQRAEINDFIKTANFRHAGIGIKVVEVSSGKTICAYNEQTALCPASCMKLVSSATALEALGSDFTYKTILFTNGTLDSQGDLQGDLYIKGVGDPTLGSGFIEKDPNVFLDQWLTDIRKAGIKAVNGDIIALDDLFGYEGVSPWWIWVDIGNYYAPGIYGISVFDNTYRLSLKSGAVGTCPEILGWEPATVPLKFENNLKAAANNTDSAYIYGQPFDPERKIFGTIPQNRSSFTIKGDIPDPGLFLASHFKAVLEKAGIRIVGEASTSRLKKVRPEEKKILSQTISPDLEEVIRVTNFRSNNHYAEYLFKRVGAGNKVKELWKIKGLDTDALFMYDGSGLSPVNAVSVDFLTGLLVYMASKSKYSEACYRSLPRAGKEGTVAGFLKNTSLDGISRIKSGSMGGVLSYSGYIDKNGKRYAFSVILNKFNGAHSEARKQVEKLLVSLFNNPQANIGNTL